VIHYGVSNIPGAVPRTSTLALTNATLPYAMHLARSGWRQACAEDTDLARGINVAEGRVVHSGVAEAFGMTLESLPVLKAVGRRGEPRVRFKRLAANPDLPLPARASVEAAGFDIRSCETFRLAPGRIHAAATGLIMEMPAGLECQVRPRSGLAARYVPPSVPSHQLVVRGTE